MLKASALAAAALFAAALPADAALYQFDYSGTSASYGAFSASVILDIGTSGTQPGSISGNRNGVAITGFSSYAGGDNLLSNTYSYVDYNGASYKTADGTSFNVYWDGSNFYELNSATNPNGDALTDARLTSAAVHAYTGSSTPVTSTPSSPSTSSPAAVPEAATWAMMLAGFGMVGGALRRRQVPAVSFG